jgi:hypothetical protein
MAILIEEIEVGIIELDLDEKEENFYIFNSKKIFDNLPSLSQLFIISEIY